MTYIPAPVLIDKEKISGLYFPDSEVLLSEAMQDKRSRELQSAAELCTLDHITMKILFEDIDGLKQSEAAIWAVTNQRVILKHGATIPIKRIHEIKI